LGGAFGDAEKRSLIQRVLPHSLDSVLEELAAADGQLEGYLRFDQKYYLPDDILMKVDRTSMAHAVEVRPPYLDHRIVEFANSLPASFRINGRRQKVILRDSMRNKLGAAILQRKKIGFDIPAHDWFRGRCGQCSKKPWHLPPPSMEVFLTYRRLWPAWRLISIGALIWAFTYGD